MPSTLRNDLEALEKALVAQWANFGEGPGGSYNDDGELAWTEAPVAQLPYNAIVRTQLTSDAENRIDAMVNPFRNRGVQFIWVVHPSARPANLEELLPKHGLSVVSNARGYGVGTRLTELALERAAELGKSRVVLASSEMGPNVYRRIGFKQTHVLPRLCERLLSKGVAGGPATLRRWLSNQVSAGTDQARLKASSSRFNRYPGSIPDSVTVHS
jgi:GNAT superfamily N-acetyltransferase